MYIIHELQVTVFYVGCVFDVYAGDLCAGRVARETKLKSTAAFQSPLLGSGIAWAGLPPLGEICGHTTSEQIVQFSCECIALYTTYVQHMQFMTYNVLTWKCFRNC